ncbi:hypothetical protein CRE_10487 [Caenorhabditis remanei]|uniref:F-box domain-containing protein n=1 Tax=Caenorhabditis remanei TaxID=31234 RepID=E3N0V2_CAERE|nr:hypothetical protein CRE_10487 [Caenorhabditis remanei]
MTTPFPLLRLPRLALFPVFEQMEEREIIAFSLLSKRAHNLSKSLRKLSATSIKLTVEKDSHHLTAYFKYRGAVGPLFYSNSTAYQYLVFQNETISREKVGLSVSEWIERIQDVTNCKSLKRVDLRGPPRLDICDALSSLKNISELYIHPGCPNSFAKKALEILSPVTTEINIWKIPFENRDEFSTFLMSNLNFLNFDSHGFSRFYFDSHGFSGFDLDDFLVTNALKVRLEEFVFFARVVSQFFTNWFHSKRKSRLEHLSLVTIGDINETCLPETLNAIPYPRDQERTFFYSKQLDTPSKTFSGGYDIERTDGKKATIVFVPPGDGGLTFFDFYVWP